MVARVEVGTFPTILRYLCTFVNDAAQAGAFRSGARPFGFLVLEPVAGSSKCCSLRDSGFDKGNPKGLVLVDFRDNLWYSDTHN